MALKGMVLAPNQQ